MLISYYEFLLISQFYFVLLPIAISIAFCSSELKAISQLLESKFDIEWKEIEILNDEDGRPCVNLLKQGLDIDSIDISISHCKTYAVASVVVMYK